MILGERLQVRDGELSDFFHVDPLPFLLLPPHPLSPRTTLNPAPQSTLFLARHSLTESSPLPDLSSCLRLHPPTSFSFLLVSYFGPDYSTTFPPVKYIVLPQLWAHGFPPHNLRSALLPNILSFFPPLIKHARLLSFSILQNSNRPNFKGTNIHYWSSTSCTCLHFALPPFTVFLFSSFSGGVFSGFGRWQFVRTGIVFFPLASPLFFTWTVLVSPFNTSDFLLHRSPASL